MEKLKKGHVKMYWFHSTKEFWDLFPLLESLYGKDRTGAIKKVASPAALSVDCSYGYAVAFSTEKERKDFAMAYRVRTRD